ncbi:MAG TPA: adenylosuccinate lyase, partial [Candidatus Acetothermia bacterium]|nr:adenylosuccinate lyase [Candidatus Acetothermia bacterium]
KELWTLPAQYERWLEVELAALEALEELGEIPAGISQAIRSKAKLDPEAILAREQELGHDLLAFLEVVEEEVGPEGRFLHLGLTSSDVKDTALALILRDALTILLSKATRLGEAVWELAQRYRQAPMLGRTHGQSAEPITFGLKVLNWYQGVEWAREGLERAREEITVGKLSGAVGTYAHFPPQAEALALGKLGLAPCPVTTQVVPRERHARVLFALAQAASQVEVIALEVRHLSRSEVGELAEGRPAGSSAMPHKRNPILAERLCGLARLVRAGVGPALENCALWHERDMSHSSVERILFPQCFTVVDYMLEKARELVEGLRVYPEKMLANLLSARGLPFSEGLLLALVRAGLGRKEAHKLVRALAQAALREGRELREVAAGHPKVREALSEEVLEQVFELRRALRYVDEIFQRFSGDEKGS